MTPILLEQDHLTYLIVELSCLILFQIIWKIVENITLQTFKNFLKIYFLDLNKKVTHLEELYCINYR